eukprot:TRINITY_DN6021_c0_g1_i1.p1 TRINITY_DN6021_c0_g1~~TRINITY_DN6021_c0_g1_i1.p1  ORF type:complete len:720 (-),score=169.11 TRINITY_DN6021_c0_g1_i1:58-2217(-)
MSPAPDDDEGWSEEEEEEEEGEEEKEEVEMDSGGDPAAAMSPEDVDDADGGGHAYDAEEDYGAQGAEDYGDESYEDSDSVSSDDDSQLPVGVLWPDPFDEGTEASSEPSRSRAGSVSPTAVALVDAGQLGLQGFFRYDDQQASSLEAVSSGMKVVCLSQRPDREGAEPEEERSSASMVQSSDLRRCPADYWASFHQWADWPCGAGLRTETQATSLLAKQVLAPILATAAQRATLRVEAASVLGQQGSLQAQPGPAPPISAAASEVRPPPAKQVSVLLPQEAAATMLTGGSSSSSSSSPPAPSCPLSSASPPRGMPAPALMAAPGSAGGNNSKGSRRLVCARQKAGLRPRPPAQRPERRAPGPRSARLQASSRPTSNQSSSGPAPGGFAAAAGAGASSRRPRIPEEPPPGLPQGGGLPIQDERAKTPCYEVSEEELERLLLAGALAGRPLESGDTGEGDEEEEEEDHVYEISEEDFERLLQAGQLHLAVQEDQVAAAAAGGQHLMCGRFKPPPSTAPAELPRRVPTASLQARPRLRPQTVDCGHETKKKAFVGGQLDTLLFLLGESPPSSASAATASALASVPPAAGSPLQSARLLRGLRAGLSQQHQPACSSSQGESSALEDAHGQFPRKRPMGSQRAAQGSRPLPRAAASRQEKRERVVSKSKCSAEGDDDTAEKPLERPPSAGTTLGDSPAFVESGCEGSRFLASPSPEESLAENAC